MLENSQNSTRYFIKLAYDGTNFSGWQRQKNAISVQEVLEDALTLLIRSPQKVLGCGRTDAGVHADIFYAHWDGPSEFDPIFIIKLNGILPRTIGVYDVFPVAENANARYDATNRKYHYFFHTNKNPFLRHFSFDLPYPDMDFELMQKAAEKLLDYTEFLPLIKLDKEKKKTTCYLTSSKLIALDIPNAYCYEISANRFLHNMVRRIMGMLFQIGRHKLSFDTFVECMDTQSEFKIKALAPAKGLHLVDITYPYNKN